LSVELVKPCTFVRKESRKLQSQFRDRPPNTRRSGTDKKPIKD
jgi:hypothetical protein